LGTSGMDVGTKLVKVGYEVLLGVVCSGQVEAAVQLMFSHRDGGGGPVSWHTHTPAA